MPTLSGSLNVTGSVNVTGSFTLNGNIVTSGTITSNGPNTFNGNVIVTGSLTATGGVTASLQGSASYALDATFANNIQITNTTSSLGGPFYPLFTATNNGYGGALVDTSIFIYTPTTNTLSVNIAGNVTGSLTGSLLGSLIGTSSYATRAVAGDKIKAANIAGSGILYPLLGSSFFGDVDVYSIQSTDYKYDLSTNQLIASSISASFIGSLLGTAATASNITPSIASDGVNRILTSDGDGTVTAEANLTFDGNTLLVAGSLNQSGSFKIGYSGSNYSTFQVSKNISNYDNVFITSGADGLSHEDMIYIQTQPTAASNLIGIQTQGKIDIYADKAAFRSNASGGSRVQITGSLNVANGITGSLQGTGSYALNALSASYAPTLLPYSVYTALLSLSSGTFTVNQLQNTIGDGTNTSPNDIQWSNPSNGVIRGTKSGAFDVNTKLLIFVPSMRPSGVSYFVAGGLGSFMSGSLQYAPTLNITRHDNDQTSTPNFTDLPIEIRVYN